MAEETGPARIPTRAERNAATSQRDHGGGPPKEAPAINDRPNDTPLHTEVPAYPNSTMASRAKAREKRDRKQVDADDDVEDKAVSKSQAKRK